MPEVSQWEKALEAWLEPFLEALGHKVRCRWAPVYLRGLFAGAVSKDTVIRAWHRVQSEWQAWQKRDLAADQIVRLIFDGTVVKVRIDRQATALSILVAMGVRQDGQKVILAIRSMGGESEAAWRAVLDDLVTRGMTAPSLVIVDGAPGLEAALAALWPAIPVQSRQTSNDIMDLAGFIGERRARCRAKLRSVNAIQLVMSGRGRAGKTTIIAATDIGAAR